MKRGHVLTGVFLITALLAAGCSTEDDNISGGEPAGYARMDGLEGVTMSSGEPDAGPENGPETENVPESVMREADGSEATQERELVADADVYSKPDQGGAVVGSADQGTVVQVISPVEDGEWYKVVYKGRVAYIPADAVADSVQGGGEADPETGPAAMPTAGPTTAPTARPTTAPTARPTTAPTARPTAAPTARPTTAPSAGPTAEPTMGPPMGITSSSTAEPSSEPTQGPTSEPTQEPATEPTEEPTQEPASEPTPEPATEPTEEPVPDPIL